MRRGDKHFYSPGGDKHFYTKGEGQTFSVGSDGGNDDVDGEEEEDVSEAKLFVRETSKPSAGTRILRGP